MKLLPVMRTRTAFDQLIACAPLGSAGLMPRTRYHQAPVCVRLSGRTIDVAAVVDDHVDFHGYDLRDSCTSYVVAPTAGSHATSGESCTVGSFDADATMRPSGESPDTHGVP